MGLKEKGIKIFIFLNTHLVDLTHITATDLQSPDKKQVTIFY